MSPDLDDTVARPPRPATVERAIDHRDVEDTITWTRPATAPIDVATPAPAPAAPAPATPMSAPAASAPAAPTPLPSTLLPSAELAPPAPPEIQGSVPDDATIQSPPSLVEPPAPVAIGQDPFLPSRLPPPPATGTAIPDVSDNIWSEPLPDKPLPFRIRLDDGTLVPLDQPVYLGRKPSVPRIHPGGIPLLVTFDSPQREVSSTHLELTTVGGAIVATDLKSTNGSIVRVPGAAPHTLLGGESAVLTPGTLIELGDGNSIELLAPDHPDAAESQLNNL